MATLLRRLTILRIHSSRPLHQASLNQSGCNHELEINIQTEIPGPKSTKLRNELLECQQVSTVSFVSDVQKSLGNYIVDVDSNTYLDCFMQIASLPLGYNSPDLIKALSSPENIHQLVNRPAMGWFPNEEWIRYVTNVFMAMAPPGLEQIYPMMCGTCSNENALKIAFMKYMDKQRGGRLDFTEEELQSVMTHSAPGSPNLSILSFKGGFHGRTVGLLSVSNSRALHGIDIPTLKWPKADFPRYKYPLGENQDINRAEDLRCLEILEDTIREQNTKTDAPVAGMIVEPIQAEGGDFHGSKFFFQGVDRIAHKYDISLIIDEVQTGGGSTGKMWCHEHFELEHGPDIVTFSKKMLSGGIYHKKTHRPQHAGRILNTWLGDPHKVIMLSEVWKYIQTQNTLALVDESGKVLLSGLMELEKRFPGHLSSSRGLGTFCAVDCPKVEMRDEIVGRMLKKGVLIGACGEATIRFRPCLIFEPKHAAHMLEKMGEVLLEMTS
uniref:4-aminobutyrate aminotransferase, mitochondrial n=1 Tax=Caligus rogercresseyi TaxID=217165 RepID=C1BQU6_CALRO|nr:4-aminobutyrate aminotransferase, mitochondrial precursor [Caligus rogercresseyi]